MSKELGRPAGKNGQKLVTQRSFAVSTPGITGCSKTLEKWKDQEHLEL
jgi:hypothetical protein